MNNTNFVTKFMSKIYSKIPKEYLRTIENQLVSTLDEYEVIKKSTEVAAIGPDLDKELKEYLVTMKIEKLADTTIKLYKYQLTRFIYAVGKPINEISATDIKLYLYRCQEQSNIKDITVNNIKNCISTFFTWLYNNEYIDKNPCKNIRSIKCETNTRHSLSLDEMELLRLACRSNRESAMLEFLYCTGCRCSEMVNVRISDIDFKDRSVVVTGKGNKKRRVYISSRCAVLIDEYFKSGERKGTEYLFTKEKAPYDKIGVRMVENIIKRIHDDSGITSKLTPHIIRHTTATVALDNGMPIEQVSKMLGHTSIDTTLIYAEVKDDNLKHYHQRCLT